MSERARSDVDRLFRLSPDLLCIAGTDGYFKRVNPAFEHVLGYTEDELLSRSFLDLVHPDDRDETLGVLDQLRGGEPMVDYRNRYRAKDGSFRWLQWRSTAVDDEGLVYAVARDVTDALQAQRVIASQAEELARSNEDLEQFAYAASHDLQAPLRSIESLIGFLEEDLNDPGDAVVGHLVRLRSRSQQMRELVEDLLTYSRAGRHAGQIRPIRVREMVGEIVRLLAVPEDFAVEVEGPDEEMVTAAAPLEQVLRNLIANSVKHHDREQGRVLVTVRRRETDWEFTVSDDGPGVPDEYRERAFRMFERLDPEESGSGLGLALVKKVVGRLGGEIEILPASTRGTSVRFTWPITPPGSEER